MEKIFGRDVGILNEATQEGNREIDQLKYETLLKELAELQKNIKALENQEIALNEKIKQEQKNFTDMQTKFKPRKNDLERVNKLAKQIKPAVLSKNVSLPKEDWDFIVDIAKQHARISDTTLAALESQSEVIEKLQNCQRLYLAIASELAAITQASDREKLKHAVQNVLKDIEDWRVVTWTFDDMTDRKPSSLEEILRAREDKISKKYSYAQKNKEYNQPSVAPKKQKKKKTHEI
jgi:flagellar motility protein MotE (MotC chaperone)